MVWINDVPQFISSAEIEDKPLDLSMKASVLNKIFLPKISVKDIKTLIDDPLWLEPVVNAALQPQADPSSQVQAGPSFQPQAGPSSQPKTDPFFQPQAGPSFQLQTEPLFYLQAGPSSQPKTDPFFQPQAGPFFQPQAGPSWYREPEDVEIILEEIRLPKLVPSRVELCMCGLCNI
ncbi:probable G-protein coupled receptor 152 [Leptopilina heterotoma]|uniref:probable G-protein coupled receptor 152 n=1 Tax=Leptopilina heterotoma TaxID=63436 RepID=UPI001CA964C8|nr:probable G-protein coupled receptor 152 [Leptopilina heterotoma]